MATKHLGTGTYELRYKSYPIPLPPPPHQEHYLVRVAVEEVADGRPLGGQGRGIKVVRAGGGADEGGLEQLHLQVLKIK